MDLYEMVTLYNKSPTVTLINAIILFIIIRLLIIVRSYVL